MDIKSPEDRSKNMAAIHSKNTKPDIYLRKYNTAIFIHGCFWHRHFNCKYAYIPKSRVEFWQNKFETNTKRDYVVRMKLQDRGIKCLIVWECTVKQMSKNYENSVVCLEMVEAFLKTKDLFLEI